MKYFIHCLTFVPAFLLACTVFSQDPAAPAAAPAAPAAAPAETPDPLANDPRMLEFRQKFAVYTEVTAKIQKLQEDFEKAAQAQDQAKIREIQASAPAILDQAEAAFMAIVPVGKELYALSDGKNEDLNQFMLVYANYLLTVDNYDEAYLLFAAFLSKGMHQKHPEIFEMAGVSAYGSNRFTAAKKCFGFAKQVGTPLSRQAQSYADSIDSYYAAEWAKELQLRQKEAQADNLPRVQIRTTAGDIVVELFENEAPNSVANFITLAESGFYNNLAFHRVLPGFMAQGGCPKGDGSGDPGYSIPEEYTKEGARKHFRGSLCMARSADPNSAGSQFYLTFLPNQSLDGNYTVFGRVIDGMQVLSLITRVDPERPYPGLVPTKIIEMKVIRKRNHDYSSFKKM